MNLAESSAGIRVLNKCSHMKTKLVLIVLALASAGRAAERSDFSAGRKSYASGEFRKAASHFEKAVKADPANAEAHFWLGKSYEVLTDIGGPLFGTRSSSRARVHLTKAMELAPERPEYRDELFNFLLGSDQSLRGLAKARAVLQTMPKSDPDYASMQSRLQQECGARASAQSRLGAVVLLVPRQVLRNSAQ